MNRIPPHLLRQLLFLLLIFLLSIILVYPLYPYIPAVMGAYTLYVILSRPMHWLTAQKRWSEVPAALALILLSFIVLAIPISFFYHLIQNKLAETVHNTPIIIQNVEFFIQRLESKYNVDLLTDEVMQNFNAWAVKELRLFIQATLGGLVTLLLAYLLLFFLLINQGKMEEMFQLLLPLRDENADFVKKQFNGLVMSNAVGIPLLGILQGFAGLIAYWIAGVPDMWLWFAITCISGMLPVIGVAFAYVPLAIVTYSLGEPVKALVLLLYGFFIIGSADNVARMWLQKKIGDTHPLITFFGVIAGLKLFGFVGFIFGPVLISLLILLLRIYVKEFGKDHTS
ncbi:MAG: AI-2E family transporter [Saprospiraceae bacterium]|nr:AI-2E family transporter [Saprospiraceae bacterium]